MLSANELKNDILNDMRVELSDEFDRNLKRTPGVIVCAWLPFLCKKSLSLKIAVELIG